MKHLDGVSISSAMCEQDQIAEFDSIAADFLRNVFHLEPASCCLSDDSELDDFAHMALPQELIQQTMPLNDGDVTWDDWVIARIRDCYGVELSTTRIYLVNLFNQIEQTRNQRTH